MRSRQTGITFIGFLLIAAMVGVVGFSGLRLWPAYYENFKIRQILNEVKSEWDGQAATPATIRRSISKRLDIEMVEGFTAREFEVEKSAGGFIVAARYERIAPLLGNVSFLVEFDDEVEIGP
jgi:hypothetical protein